MVSSFARSSLQTTRSSRSRAVATVADPSNKSGDMIAERANPARRTTRSMGLASLNVPPTTGTRSTTRARNARQTTPAEDNKNPYTPAIKKASTTNSRVQRRTNKLTPPPEKVIAATSPVVAVTEQTPAKPPMAQQSATALDSRISFSFDARASPLSSVVTPDPALLKPTTDPLKDTEIKTNPLPVAPSSNNEVNQSTAETMYTKAPVDYLPLLPRPAAVGFSSVLNKSLWQWKHPRMEDLVISGMSGAQVYNLLTALSEDSGSVDSNGTPMATLASLRFLVEDPLVPVQISRLLKMHDEFSEQMRIVEMAAAHQYFPVEYAVVMAYTDGWHRAMKETLMGVSMDAAAICDYICRMEEVPKEERRAMMEYVLRLVDGAKRAGANTPLAPGEDASNRTLCVTVASLLLFALKTVLAREVPAWMYNVLADNALASVTCAVALQDRIQPGPVVEWPAVWDAMNGAAAEEASQYEWCRAFMSYKQIMPASAWNPVL